MGWGGKRPGAGAKPKPKQHLAFAQSSVPTTNATSPIEEFDAPDALTMDERKVWLQQAPFAFAQRTLVRSTALSFERYCRVVVMERKEAESSARGGANHRGLLNQINAYELQFLLAPCGKPMPAIEKPAEVAPSKLSRFRKAG